MSKSQPFRNPKPHQHHPSSNVSKPYPDAWMKPYQVISVGVNDTAAVHVNAHLAGEMELQREAKHLVVGSVGSITDMVPKLGSVRRTEATTRTSSAFFSMGMSRCTLDRGRIKSNNQRQQPHRIKQRTINRPEPQNPEPNLGRPTNPHTRSQVIKSIPHRHRSGHFSRSAFSKRAPQAYSIATTLRRKRYPNPDIRYQADHRRPWTAKTICVDIRHCRCEISHHRR